MLLKFISVSETCFQNTETVLKNQQASIQGLKTQIGQLSKLISERPQGSLPSNTEPNPREHLNAISTQYKEGFIAPKLELMQETVVSKGKSEVSLHFVWETKRSPFKLVILASHRTLKKLSFKEVHESCSKNDRGHIHKERRLWIEKLDEWRAHKSRTHDKPKLRQNETDTSPNQLKVGDKVLQDAANPHIVTTTPNKEIPLTVLSIFPFGTVEVSHSRFDTFKLKHTGVREANEARDGRTTWPCEPTRLRYHVIIKRKQNRRTCFEEEKGSVLFRRPNRENSSPSPTVSPRAPGRTVLNTSGPTLNYGPLHRLGYRRTSPDS
ncbi:hypothetical protein GOBAR_AA04760 [Gossypium barbadense]|uniref:Uncharacterized protein n=1 Tax=Gossypium barbadense TaxID=3634 RepID=A0A2P5YJP3_GOSBA|nr:hypothetical protein GOBAR_AA04760 [Gossypium barbadense]